MGSSSPNQDQTWTPCIGSAESQPLSTGEVPAPCRLITGETEPPSDLGASEPPPQVLRAKCTLLRPSLHTQGTFRYFRCLEKALAKSSTSGDRPYWPARSFFLLLLLLRACLQVRASVLLHCSNSRWCLCVCTHTQTAYVRLCSAVWWLSLLCFLLHLGHFLVFF